MTLILLPLTGSGVETSMSYLFGRAFETRLNDFTTHTHPLGKSGAKSVMVRINVLQCKEQICNCAQKLE